MLAVAKSIAQISIREDVFRIFRAVPQLFAELFDQNPEIGAVFHLRGRMQHGMEARMGHRTAGLRHEQSQRLELMGREMNARAGKLRGSADGIERDIADRQWRLDRLVGSAVAADGGADSRDEFADVEGLGEKVV